jgi:predicted acyl esterase
MKSKRALIFCLVLLGIFVFVRAQAPEKDLATYIRENYTKREVYIPMSDGVRIMIQIQSTWFPLVARNPQKFMPNYKLATQSDFQKVVNRVHFGQRTPSSIVLPVLKK